MDLCFASQIAQMLKTHLNIFKIFNKNKKERQKKEKGKKCFGCLIGDIRRN